MNHWIPNLASTASPRYLAIVDTLQADIAAGRVKPGARLLPQRELATRLKLSVGTVSKAYAEAERRGLISGEVGRGTFVLRRADARGGGDARYGHVANLALNVPPSTGEDQAIAEALAEIAADGAAAGLLGYLPHQGLRDHREAIAAWLATQNVTADADKLFITHGAQHAISIALGLLAKHGDVVLAETLTYSGIVALAAYAGCRLQGVEMDGEGMIPEALDRTLAATGARVVFSMPTLQTPTGSIMPEARREAIAGILRRRDAWLIEDDAYGFLPEAAPAPVSAWIPERSLYVMSFAKCLAPGLRIGAMLAPDSLRDRTLNALRATGWMAAPVMAEVVRRLIGSGALLRQVRDKRRQAAARQQIAQRVLGPHLRGAGGAAGFHVWVQLPPGRTVMSVIGQAALHGITLAGPSAIGPADAASPGIRLCLGAAASEAELERVLEVVRGIVETAEELSVV